MAHAFFESYAGKRVLVTGHTGFKGAWMCEWLLSLDAEVGGVSLGLVSDPSLYEILSLSNRLQNYQEDVRHFDALCKVFKDFQPEIVFHLAAQSLVRPSYEDPKGTFDTNVGGTVNCLEAIRVTPSVKAAVIVTTDKCYEDVGYEYSYRETDRLGGKDPYSSSKAAAELVSNAYMRSFFSRGPAVATVRAGNVIGGGDWAQDRIVPDCIRAWAYGKPVTLRNPTHVRPWQHVLEPLFGYLWVCHRLLARDPRVVNEAFNFGPDDRHCQTVSALVNTLSQQWKEQRGVEVKSDRSGKVESQYLRLNCDKAFNRLGWSPVLNFSQTVVLTAHWYETYLKRERDMVAFTREQIRQYEIWAADLGLLNWAIDLRTPIWTAEIGLSELSQ